MIAQWMVKLFGSFNLTWTDFLHRCLSIGDYTSHQLDHARLDDDGIPSLHGPFGCGRNRFLVNWPIIV